jgi:hypothetical protein
LINQDDRILLSERNHHQRGEWIMSQGVLGFQYEVDNKRSEMTALGGLPVYLEFGHVMGLTGCLRDRLGIKDDDEAWSSDRVIMSLGVAQSCWRRVCG